MSNQTQAPKPVPSDLSAKPVTFTHCIIMPLAGDEPMSVEYAMRAREAANEWIRNGGALVLDRAMQVIVMQKAFANFLSGEVRDPFTCQLNKGDRVRIANDAKLNPEHRGRMSRVVNPDVIEGFVRVVVAHDNGMEQDWVFSRHFLELIEPAR